MSLIRFLIPIVFIFAAASAWSADRKVVLGKLGQATVRTPIYSRPNTRARIYYRAAAFQYLVIRPSRTSKWMQILLKNGMCGYALASSVAQLPYEVTASAAPTVANARFGSTGFPIIGSRSGSAVAQEALRYQGTPYVWGGNSLNGGIDCSGFVKQLYGGIGVDLPRTAAEQVNIGTPVTRLEDLRPGDRLYFWESKRAMIGHTGIYLGGGYFIHSSHGRGGVATDYLGKKQWLRILMAARR